jgi:uncharacterized flavoprotein (TIGR03862 family)
VQHWGVPGTAINADVAVIGAGPAGLAAAEQAALTGASVVVVDAQRSPGRKFLLAGRSGLNMTHAEPLEQLLNRYTGSAAELVTESIRQYPPEAMRSWASELGVTTFVGSSGRVFPTEMRATPLLRAWLARLTDLGVTFASEWRWSGSSELSGVGRKAGEFLHVNARATVLALGGASWPRTGSDGKWAEVLRSAGMTIEPFGASNVGAVVKWSDVLLAKHEGEPIKNVVARCGSLVASGDVVITRSGLEGGPIYAVSAALRDGLELMLDLRPGLDTEAVGEALRSARKGDSVANRLRKAGLSSAAVALLMECGARDVADDPLALAALIKSIRIEFAGVAAIDRAISTSGGVYASMLDSSGMVVSHPGLFVVGEMLDWEAPTGGYLIQGCWSTGCRAGVAAAHYGR